MGIEIAGQVAAIGAAVTTLAVGDPVASKAFSSCGQCRYCRTGRETTCRRRRPVRGGYGEYSAIPEDALVRVPDDMPFEIACLLGPGAGVALNAVRNTAHVTIGDSVLVTGASGRAPSRAAITEQAINCIWWNRINGSRIGPTRLAGKSAPAMGTPEAMLFLEPQNRTTLRSARDSPARRADHSVTVSIRSRKGSIGRRRKATRTWAREMISPD